MVSLKLTKCVNSLGITIPKEMLEGTSIYPTLPECANEISMVSPPHPREKAIHRGALDAMSVGEGDKLFVTKTPKGYEISPKDPDFEKKMAIARQCMKEYRDVLSELAK